MASLIAISTACVHTAVHQIFTVIKHFSPLVKSNYSYTNTDHRLNQHIFFDFFLIFIIERQLISERTKAALENVKASEKKLGRPFSAQSKKLKLSKNTKRIRELLDKGISQNKISKMMQVQPITVSRFVQRMGWG